MAQHSLLDISGDINNNDGCSEAGGDERVPTPCAATSQIRRTSTCQALRLAVLKLYRLDDFTMHRIGEGFFSEVYKVTHKVSGEIMVLKMNTIDDNRPNMLREVQLMNRMSHPNILKFLGVCVHKGQLHALTEFVNGGSLHDILCGDQSTEVLWTDRVQIAIDVSAGMEYLHSKGVFHRDLTSRNILINNLSSGNVSKRGIVADFGLAAKIPDPQKKFHLSVVGSPYWIAPECIKGKPYNQTADVFSFGIILCETIARTDADPDLLPRTHSFGLDYVAYSELLDNCPLYFLYCAFQCCQMEPNKRPTFSELNSNLSTISSSYLAQFDKAPSTIGSSLSTTLILESSIPVMKFNQRLSKTQKSFSEQSLEFLKPMEMKCETPTPKVIGDYMTKADLLYEPSPAHTNPFAANSQFSAGKKLIASDTERQQLLELSVTLPVGNTGNSQSKAATPRQLTVLCHRHSLPNHHGKVQRAIAQFNAQIASSQFSRQAEHVSTMDKQFASGNSSMESSLTSHDFARHSNKQRNLECAMLFSGLDLIQIHRASSSELSDTYISTDLESEFQDDLEDVLRESKLSSEDVMMSSETDSVFSDSSSDWWFSIEQSDPLACRYLHPMLVEKRKQLKRVEKLEQLQIKLDQLKLSTKKSKPSKK